MCPRHTARRLLTGGLFAALVVAGPTAVQLVSSQPSAPSSVAACAHGESEDLFTDHCVPELSPNTSDRVETVSAPVVAGTNDSGAITESTPGDPNSLPEVDNIPINSAGQGIGLEESGMDNDIPVVDPRSTLSSSP